MSNEEKIERLEKEISFIYERLENMSQGLVDASDILLKQIEINKSLYDLINDKK